MSIDKNRHKIDEKPIRNVGMSRLTSSKLWSLMELEQCCGPTLVNCGEFISEQFGNLNSMSFTGDAGDTTQYK